MNGNSSHGHSQRFILAFGQDRQGEMHVLVTDSVGSAATTGRVYKLVPRHGAPVARGAMPVRAVSATESAGASGAFTRTISVLAKSPALVG